MKIKVFTTKEQGIITLGERELQELLNEAYSEGYRDGSLYKPYITTTTNATPLWSTTISNTDSSIKYAINTEDSEPTAALSYENGSPYTIKAEDYAFGTLTSIGENRSNELASIKGEAINEI